MAPDHVLPTFPNKDELTQEVIKRCERLKDRFAILSTVREFKPATPNLKFDTTFGALYHPWIWVYDPVTRDDQLIAPTGHMAGIIARTDIEQGVFKAPANAVVVGAKDLASPLPKAIQDLLNPIGVNCIRDFRSDRRGIRLWGARTMSSDPEWKYINVRRLFLYVEESIDEGTQWVVFEPNNEVTWGRVQRSISNFLMTIWRAGGLFGSKPEEAFFVRCDRTTMDEDDILNGRLVCQIGICPVRPAEFVIFRIGQKTADAPA
jgi:phage tail sheath protein FI